MGNRETGETSMEIGGRVYTLILDTNALCELEDLYSTPDKEVTFAQILFRAASGSVRYTRACIWAALKRHHPEITLQEVGRLIQVAGGLSVFAEKLQALSRSATPDPADAQTLGVSGKGNPRRARAKRGTGVVSISPPGVSA